MPDEHPDFVITVDRLADLEGVVAERLRALAPHTGGLRLDPGFSNALAATVGRWDTMAVAGCDDDFGRGESPIEQTWAAPARNGMPSGSLHPFSPVGPYHCVIVGPGALDTKGGPVIDERARVVRTGGEAIPRLYGAGNCIASPAGQSYWGPGATIGLAFTFGAIAGREVATQPRRPSRAAGH